MSVGAGDYTFEHGKQSAGQELEKGELTRSLWLLFISAAGERLEATLALTSITHPDFNLLTVKVAFWIM